MSYKKHIITVLVAIFVATGAANAQQKYALLIGGDYQPGNEIPASNQWNNGQDMGQNGYDEFWNDTYLMWELLYDDPITGYSNDNINVLFAGGEDYTFYLQDIRYNSFLANGFNITDASAEKVNVLSALDDLANIQEQDYLFIWIMSNGGDVIIPGENNSSFVYLWGYDPANPSEGRLYDSELKAKLDLIPAHKKVVVVQAPHSGGFATTLADDNTIIITSSQTDEQTSLLLRKCHLQKCQSDKH
jgi:subtilisin family serine protease